MTLRTQQPADCYLGLGSNLGDRAGTILAATEELKKLAGLGETNCHDAADHARLSPLYETAPVGVADQPTFLNAALYLPTHLPPRKLLEVALAIEKGFGRDRSRETRWGPRSLDIDLLLFGSQIVNEPGLVIPHPRLHERWFVLKPLCDLVPELVHPVIEKRLGDLLAQLEDQADNPQQHGRRYETT